jgi:hypothetical protein
MTRYGEIAGHDPTCGCALCDAERRADKKPPAVHCGKLPACDSGSMCSCNCKGCWLCQAPNVARELADKWAAAEPDGGPCSCGSGFSRARCLCPKKTTGGGPDNPTPAEEPSSSHDRDPTPFLPEWCTPGATFVDTMGDAWLVIATERGKVGQGLAGETIYGKLACVVNMARPRQYVAKPAGNHPMLLHAHDIVPPTDATAAAARTLAEEKLPGRASPVRLDDDGRWDRARGSTEHDHPGPWGVDELALRRKKAEDEPRRAFARDVLRALFVHEMSLPVQNLHEDRNESARRARAIDRAANATQVILAKLGELGIGW